MSFETSGDSPELYGEASVQLVALLVGSKVFHACEIDDCELDSVQIEGCAVEPFITGVLDDPEEHDVMLEAIPCCLRPGCLYNNNFQAASDFLEQAITIAARAQEPINN